MTSASIAPAQRARAVLASEWIKLTSLRSMKTTLLVAAVFSILEAVQVGHVWHRHYGQLSAADQAKFNPVDTSLQFLTISALFFGVLGSLVVTSEYGNGLIRGTFTATPQRGLVLTAKTALAGLSGFAAGLIMVLASFLIGQQLLAGGAPHATFASPGAARAVFGGAFYLMCVTLIGLFTGVLARSTAVAITAAFALFLALPLALQGLPHGATWLHTVPYLPSNLGAELWNSHIAGFPQPAVAAPLLAAWVAGFAMLSFVLLRARDT